MGMDFDRDRLIAESTAKKIKRQIGYFIKLLKGRHKRLLGGLAGVPIPYALAYADTELEYMATHHLCPAGLKRELLSIKTETIEPFEDLYFDSPISIDDILYGKQRPTQHEVLGSRMTDEEMDKISKLEEADEDEPQ